LPTLSGTSAAKRLPWNGFCAFLYNFCCAIQLGGEMKRELLPVSIIVLMFAIAAYASPLVQTPLDPAGAAASLYLLPSLTAIFYCAFMLLPHIGAYRREAEHFSAQFQGFKVIFVFMMAVIYISTLLPLLGIWGAIDPLHIIVPAIALIFFYVGYMLNFTHESDAAVEQKESERAWDNANKFGGMLFWACGALILVSLVAPADSRLWFLVLPLIFCAIAVFACLVIEYRRACKAQGGKAAAASKKKSRKK